MPKTVAARTRVQVYLTDARVVAGLNREAKASRATLSQAAGRAIARGLAKAPQADPEDRLLQMERSLRDHMRSNSRDMQIVQEVLIEVAKAMFLRLPDAVADQDPTVQATVDRRIDRLLDAAASRIVQGRDPRPESESRLDAEPRSFGAAN
ncbi:hypothetical protein [Brevundimonas aurifodinae]|uniref:CopG family transcriptional regulator n=1 Tax=Brevundimonas aurifodinae TaxID=1508312 RepID=A0ABV1NJY0_9CAUL